MADSRLTEQEWAIRLFVYTYFVEHAVPPSVEITAAHFQLNVEVARQVYHRLNAFHTLFLEPGTDSIRMANPLSAVPTNYMVHVGGKTLYANCGWDSLGIPAMLHQDATVEATISLTGETVRYAVENGNLKKSPEVETAVVHFSLPFAQWYDDLVDT